MNKHTLNEQWTDLPYILNQDQVAYLMGYKSTSRALTKLLSQGITPIMGKNGHWFTTLDMLKSTTSESNQDEQLEEIDIL